jgi:hypothetical protein
MPFKVHVTFTNPGPSTISLSIPDGQGGYLIKDVSITKSQPYVTDLLDLNHTYTLELKWGDRRAQPS